MNRSPLNPITDSDLATFQRDGAVCLRGMFDGDWIEYLKPAIDLARANHGPFTQVHAMPGEDSCTFVDYRTSDRLPAFRSFVTEGPGAEIAARVMASERVNLFADSINVKDPRTSRDTPWHQDQPSLNVLGSQICNLWLALDPVPREIGLEFFGGSHRWGRWFKIIRQLVYDEDDPNEPMPDIDALRADHEMLSWEIAPGDCIMFHSLMLHGAPGNHTDAPRRAVGAIWLGDDMVFGPRGEAMNPLLTGHGLSPGDPMDCDYFPRVWPRA